jgi:hypothetical protein
MLLDLLDIVRSEERIFGGADFWMSSFHAQATSATFFFFPAASR